MVDNNNTNWSLEIGQCYHPFSHKDKSSLLCSSTDDDDDEDEQEDNIDLATYRHHSPHLHGCNHSPTLSLIDSLCTSLDRSLWISRVKSPKSRQQRVLSEHDRKILQRMAAKRRDDLNRQANARLANHFWAVEQSEREKLKRQHTSQIKESAHARQEAERATMSRRREVLAAHESFKRSQQRQLQSSKGRRSVQRVEWMRSARRSSIARRAQAERERSGLARQRRTETAFGEASQTERCCMKMERRLDRAERLRRRLSEDYRQRLLADNETQMLLHAAKLSAAREIESEQADKLRQQIWEQDERCREIVRQKKLSVEESRAQAHWTAGLRDELRRSVSPERLSYFDLY